MWRWLLGLAVVAGILTGIVLGALNPDPVTLELVFLEWTASLGAVVAVSVCTGLVVGFAFATGLVLFSRRSRRDEPAGSARAGKSLADG